MTSDAEGDHLLKAEDATEGFLASLRTWELIVPRVKFP